ncbi:MAG: Kae1-associated kinase Bud32 [Thermofilum sp. ex4484_15]|nr:MAG: Kae1-associated kinase Bud32 [Thermofilum sp. ex4484_15]
MAYRRGRSTLEEGRVIGVGAEAVLILCTWLGLKAVKKIRIRKSYRHKVLDEDLRRERTILEARLMYEARRLGVPSPTLYDVDLDNYCIVMEYIEGPKLREVMSKLRTKELRAILSKLGYAVGILHANGIVHGDLTTSNVILKEGIPFLIDYGLGSFSYDTEERAIDLHILLRSLESTHYSLSKKAFKMFLKGYSNALGREILFNVLKKVKEIRRRGRYVKERA